MEEAASKFNITTTRDVFVGGNAVSSAIVKKLLKPYYFLNVRDAGDLGGIRDEMFFVLYAVDLSVPAELTNLTTAFEREASPLEQRLVFIVGPDPMTREMRLYLLEIGARYVAMGMSRNDDLKEYLKRVCLETHQVGSLEAYQKDLDRALTARDGEAARRITERLKDLPQSEDVLRLLAHAALVSQDHKRSEAYLKKILTMNPQNLWAANALGKSYLRNGRIAEGVEVLRKLSSFHELNSERLLLLGDAYVNSGLAREAEDAFKKGETLTAGADPRFQDGLVKVKAVERDFAGALALLAGRGLSDDIISFLNMRAIIAIKGENVAEGLSYYKCAFEGSSTNRLTQAKLKFNMGLALARSGDLAAAQVALSESIELGGKGFSRARGPLDVVKAAAKAQAKAPEVRPAALDTIDMSDWETLY